MNIDELYTVDSHEKGAEMQVKDQNGKPLDMYITLAGVDSKLYRSEKLKLSRKILDDPKGNMELFRAEAITATVLSWRGFNNKGKKLKFSNKLMVGLCLNAPYIADQADEFIASRVNFTKG